jgi:branched-chain amino acid transport system ATP-binding protein
MSVLLKAENICRYFGGVKALHNVDLEIMDDEILGVIGPNGAGKTTLFNVLTGFDKPTSGKIIFNDVDMTGKPVHEMNKAGIGRTFQNIRLFDAMTVIDNVVVGMHNKLQTGLMGIALRLPVTMKQEEEAYKKAWELLEFMGLESYAYEQAGSLPYGIQKKIEISRALASEPKLLLLDEPAAGMNPQESKELMNFIKEIRTLCPSVVVIEHNMNLIMGVSERVVVLNFGEKLADCKPDEAKCDQKVIEAYLGHEED